MFKRILLFLAANAAIIAVISVILTVFNVQPYLTPYGLDYRALFLFSAIVGFTGAFISLFISKWMAKMAYSIQIIETPTTEEEVFLVQSVQSLSVQADIGMPEVGIYDSPEANAFATGWNKNNALVAVSTGLLNSMDEDELEGVLAHEIAHIANGDMVTMTLLQGVINTFVIFFARIAAYAVQNFLNRNRDNGEQMNTLAYHFTAIIFEILFGILASILLMWFSRYREFRADAGSASLVGPEKMIAALQALKRVSDSPKDNRGKSFSTMKISDKPSRFLSLFSSHPPLSDRINALKNS
jgi:heat shock protein HtpX